jgi:hypothetical protein
MAGSLLSSWADHLVGRVGDELIPGGRMSHTPPTG